MLSSKFLLFTCALLILSYVASGHPMALNKSGLEVNRVKETRSPSSPDLKSASSLSGETGLGTQHKQRSPFDCKHCSLQVESKHATSHHKRDFTKVKPAGTVDNIKKRDGKDVSKKSTLDPKIVLSLG